MKLKDTVNEYVAGMDEMTAKFKKKFGELILDEDIDIELLELMRNMFGMIDISNRLVRDQAYTIQEIDEKLDQLLERS